MKLKIHDVHFCQQAKQYKNNSTLLSGKKIIPLLLLVLSCGVFAQNTDKRVERIKALRIAFISDKLDLSTEEAQKFWPVFNQFDDKQMELQRQKKQLLFKLRHENISALTDKETAKLMEQDEQLETEIQNNRRQLAKDLQGIIPNQKILMLKQLEIEFKNKLLQQMKNRNKRFRN
ncbi:sensor of ECF-type sigma factor [Flavobacterium sp.]|uniref:sensor of ECF-type sigma factor n=1 Tax=Flavobacterium sp. TaxID=239 RepID=UPI003D6A384C